MTYTRQNDPYALRLAGDLLDCCEKKTADFLNPMAFPYYTQDMFTNQVLRDAGQLQTLLNNASHGNQYINYAPTYIMQDTKRSWLKNLKKDDKEIGCIIYKGKDEEGNKHYEMMSPAKKFNPGGVNESPMTQNPVPDIGICRQTPSLDARDPKGIEKYITDVIGNYFNAAFTKTPYFPPQWGGKETEMLSKALNADPSIALRSAQQAYTQATSVKMENTINQELNDNVREAIKQGLPPFNTKKQEAIIGPVNINGNSVPANGVDFINSYYNGINGKTGAAQSNTTETVTQNGYIPYQTNNENPKNIDRYLVEQYGNIMNASLTGAPYSGSVTPAQLKTLSSGIEAKMANDPAYMSGIVNQAQQNVVGFNYMPYDKDDFITKARDPSSREFKLLDEMIAGHVYDILKNNKVSFNGEFQELSKDLTEKIKNTDAIKEVKKPSTRASAAKTSTAKTTSSKTTSTGAAKTTAAKTTSTGASAAKKTGTSAASTANGAKKPSTGASTAKASSSGASTAKTSTAKASAAKKAENPAASAAEKPSAKTSTAQKPSTGTSTAKMEEKPAVNASAAERPSARVSTANAEENPSLVPNTEKKEERPSFLREVTDFVKNKIVDKKPALVLVDTFLGTIVDKAKKIVRTGKTIAAAFVIATNVLAPNLQMAAADQLARMSAPNAVTVSVNQNDFKSSAQGTVKAEQHVQQKQQTRTSARR